MNNTLTQKAYQHIYDQLSRGQLQLGKRLSNRSIAKEIGISFTPVREALSRLVSEGVLEYRQGIGVLVPILNVQEIRENYELREIIEAEVVARIVKVHSETMLVEMTKTYEHMKDLLSRTPDLTRKNDLVDLVLAWQANDLKFHLALLRALNNRRLLDMVKELHASLTMKMTGTLFNSIPSNLSKDMEMYSFFQKFREHLSYFLQEHKYILEIIRQRDPITTKAMVVQHIRSELQLFLNIHYHKHMTSVVPFLEESH